MSGALVSGLTSVSDAALLDAWRDLERQRRVLAAREHEVIAEVAARGLAGVHGARNLTSFARSLLRIGSGDAHARVKAAEAMAPRRELSGAPLPPLYPVVAAAQGAGEMSAAHARVIVDTIDALPDQVQLEHADSVEAFLVDKAREFDPDTLRKLARRVTDTLDPDGLLKDADYRDRTRDLTLRRRADGSGRLEGDLTAECAEFLETALNSLAAPRPESDGIKDPRTPGQRRHDALLDVLKLVMRARLLPSTSGVTTTVLVTASAEALASGDGLGPHRQRRLGTGPRGHALAGR